MIAYRASLRSPTPSSRRVQRKASRSSAPPRRAVPRAPTPIRTVTAPAGDSDTTIAVKRVDDRPASAIFTVANKKSPGFEIGAHLDDPWLRAVMLSPSVGRFLTTLALGNRDFTALACADGEAGQFGDDDVRARAESRP